jgi:chromate transporter
MSESAAFEPAAEPKAPELSELFFAFLGVSLSGFGGVLPWARRMLVEQRGWLSEREFAEALALCQFLPGPNIVNMSVVVGARFRGLAGVAVSFLGLVAVPLLIMMALGALYVRYGELEMLRGTLAGLAASAAGLIVAMAAKMAAPLVRAREIPALLFALLAFVAVGVLRIPLYWAVLVLAPLSVGIHWWRLR